MDGVEAEPGAGAPWPDPGADHAPHLELPVDLVVNESRPGQVGEHLLAVPSGRLDDDVAHADQPLEEGFGGSRCWSGPDGDLPAPPPYEPTAIHDPNIGDHHADGLPSDVAPYEPAGGPGEGGEAIQVTQMGADSTAAATAPATVTTTASMGRAMYRQCGCTSTTTISPSLRSRSGKAPACNDNRPQDLRKPRPRARAGPVADASLTRKRQPGTLLGIDRPDPVAAPAAIVRVRDFRLGARPGSSSGWAAPPSGTVEAIAGHRSTHTARRTYPGDARFGPARRGAGPAPRPRRRRGRLR